MSVTLRSLYVQSSPFPAAQYYIHLRIFALAARMLSELPIATGVSDC